jgi:LPS-assembly protein
MSDCVSHEFPYNKGFNSKNRVPSDQTHLFMSRIPAFPPQSPMRRVLTAVVTAVTLPGLAFAQSTSKRVRTDDKNAPATIQAEQMTGRPDREVHLERDVEIIRGQTRLTADQADYDIVENEVQASGNIRMQRFGDRYKGDQLKLNMDTGKGFILHPEYKLELNNAQGKAERTDFENEDQATVINGTYSTCEGPDPDWYLKAGTLELDSARDIGAAYRSVVFFKGVPIMGLPAMSFPLTDARKSGVLPPTIGATSKGGLEVALPYYFNIAPNRDLTLFPKYITRRGLQLGADGRYLGQTYSGETNVETLFHDQQTGTNRYAITSVHNQLLSPGLTFAWNINAASDDDYPSDFASSITTSSQRLLLRESSLNYAAPYWSAAARVTNYQLLQDVAAPITRPYDRLPQLTLHAARPDLKGFSVSFDSELTHFSLPDNDLAGRARGTRFVVNPQVAFPLIRPGYFVTPKLSLHATTYNLDTPADAAPGVTSLTRVLPTLSIDSGLVFERDTQFFGRPATQTLEPRLFYVKTPFRDQRLYPNFDSADAGFGFAQLFSENRFSGSDRIGDANQVTAALVSRYIEANGVERLRLAVGQRFYFSQQRVTLDNTGVGSNDNRSDLLLAASGHLSSTLSLDSALQYSQSTHRQFSSNYGVQWQPGPKRVLNVEYRYLRDTVDVAGNSLEQFNVSGQWPLARRWYAVGRINYSLPEHKTVEGLFGMEYNADCWVFRLVAQRFPTATQTATTALFFQLQLNGLSKIGPSPLEALRKNIPGYQAVNTSSAASQ